MKLRKGGLILVAAVAAAFVALYGPWRGRGPDGAGDAALRSSDLPVFSDADAGSVPAPPRDDGKALSGPGSLGGVVLDGAGRPVAGAEVAAAAEGNPRPVRGESGPDGRFSLAGLPAGVDLLLGVRSPGFAPTMVGSLRTGRDDVTLILLPPARIRGTVRSGAGEPRPGARVDVLLRFPGVALPLPVREAHADESGSFSIEGIPPVEGTAEASWKGATSGPVGFDAGRDAGSASLVLIVDEGPALSGRVLSAGGDPLAGVDVYAKTPGGYSLSTATRQDGTWSIACKAAEPHGLRVSDIMGQYLGAELDEEVTPPRSGIDFTLQPNPRAPGWFSFRCVDPSGRPVEHLFGEGRSIPEGEAGLGEWKPGADGVFRSGHMGATKHVYRFRSPLGTVSTGEFEVVAGKVTDLGLLRLSPGARVRLRVVDDAGRPLDGALVLVGETRIPERRSETDPAVFDVPGLPPGSGVVRIAHPTRERREIPWAAGPGETADLGDVVLAAGTGTVRGIVKSETHGPVPGITLTLTMKGISTRGDTHLTTVSGAGGRFEFTGVAAGEWESAFLLPATPDELDRDGKRSLLSFRRGPEVVLEPGGTAEIEIPW
ncbi:MAG: carboxypeptidase-like regulatory domain-containing protein [Planctomycetes bacterium]|nr:carboxypeptidase-like regulatory domain-containing protein [Planctomycetota bacterium]